MADFLLTTSNDRVIEADSGDTISVADGEQVMRIAHLAAGPLSDEERQWLRRSVVPFMPTAPL